MLRKLFVMTRLFKLVFVSSVFFEQAKKQEKLFFTNRIKKRALDYIHTDSGNILLETYSKNRYAFG